MPMLCSDNHPRQPLFYIVDWLPPDFGAVGQYALNFAREQAAGGGTVCLIGLTSAAPSKEVLQFEADSGGKAGTLTVLKLHAKPYDRGKFLQRLLWTLSTNSRLLWAALRHPGLRRAEVHFTGAPPFMLYFMLVLKFLRGVRLVYRITDFYPEAIIAHLGRRPFLLALLERLTWFLRQRVDQFEVLGEDQRAILERGSIPPERIVVKRYSSPVPIRGDEPPAATPASLAGKKILLYSGNYGVAHDVETVVQGLRQHQRDGGQFGLWLNATGSNAEVVESRLTELGIPVAHTQPVALDTLPSLLAAADVHLIALRSEFAGIVFPSKVHGCILSGRPILFVGPESSDVHLLCAQARQRYIRVEPGDAAGFARALHELAAT